MYEDHTVAVVIPAYNEAGFVGDVIETIPDYVDRIYPVDDCSTDGTWAEIRQAATDIDGEPPSDGGSVAADGSGPDRGRSSPGPSPEPRSDGGVQSVEESSQSAGAPEENGHRPVETTETSGFDRRVVPIQHEENRGVGGAIKTGYQRARADRIDVTVVMGGDGQMDPDWLPDLLDPVVDGRAEYAKANRLLVDEHHETMPRHRFVGNHLLTVLTKIATGYWAVGDPQHGYTAISLEALETAGIDELYEFFGYCNDLLIRLSAENLRVADVPCPLTYADEESHIDYSSYIPRVSGMLLRSFLRRLWVDRGSAAGRGRLALFVGGAIATVGGLLGIVAAGLTSSSSSSTPASTDQQPADETSAASDDGTYTVQFDDQAEIREDEGTEGVTTQEDETRGDATQNDGTQEDDEVPEAPAEQAASDPSTGAAVPESSTGSGGSGVYRAAVVAIAGVAALLGAMLVDAVTNSNNNYTERVPEGSGPRTDESE